MSGPQTKKESKYYIFGDYLGKIMAGYSMKFQYESSMMGYVLILLSLFVYIIYDIFWASGEWYWRAFAVVNCLCGILILWSNLITTLQQYAQFRMITDFQKDFMKGGQDGKETN